MVVDPVTLMIEVIKENTPNSIWLDAPLSAFREVANTNRGDIGEEFVTRYLQSNGIEVVKAHSRIEKWDLEIRKKRFEVKTASEDSNGSFQFNHIRLDREYDYLMCLAVRPDSILYRVWRKGDLAEGKAGNLVRMAEGQGITHKLTLRSAKLISIDELPNWVDTQIPTGN